MSKVRGKTRHDGVPSRGAVSGKFFKQKGGSDAGEHPHKSLMNKAYSVEPSKKRNIGGTTTLKR